MRGSLRWFQARLWGVNDREQVKMIFHRCVNVSTEPVRTACELVATTGALGGAWALLPGVFARTPLVGSTHVEHIVSLAIVLSLVFRWRYARAAAALPSLLSQLGRCQKCGYLTDGSDESVCPECGAKSNEVA